jgi:hypothetical protein
MRGTESCTNCLSWNDDFKREKKPEAVSLMFSYSLPTVIISSALTYPIPLPLLQSPKLQYSTKNFVLASQREPSSSSYIGKCAFPSCVLHGMQAMSPNPLAGASRSPRHAYGSRRHGISVQKSIQSALLQLQM